MEEAKEVLLSRDLNFKSMEKINVLEKCHLVPLKSQISSLKYAMVESNIAQWFHNKIGDIDENNCLMEDEEKEKMNKSKEESENTKNNMADIEEEMKKLSQTIEASFKSNQEKTSLIENQLSIVEVKEEKYKKILERKQLFDEQKQLYFNDSEKNVSKDNLQEKVQQTEEATKQCVAAIETLKEHKLLLNAELHTLRELSEGLEEKRYSLKKEQEMSLNKNKEQERIMSSSNLLKTLSGLKVVNAVDNCITVEIQDIQQQVPTEERAVMLLTMQFVEVDGLIVVEDVKTDSLTFFINDIIEQVKSTSQLRHFILEVQKRFHNEAKLLKEMNMLQERFAIDWDKERQTVRVMLGKAGQIVCTLKMHNGYPTTGHVSVEEIHGADQNLLFHDMTNELKSLTNWIEYIFIKYGSL